MDESKQIEHYDSDTDWASMATSVGTSSFRGQSSRRGRGYFFIYKRSNII